MKLRNGATVGAVAYYRLIGSVHAGDPVQPGDTWGSNSHTRDRALTRYAGPQHRAVTFDEYKEIQRNEQDSPPDTQQPATLRSGAPRGS